MKKISRRNKQEIDREIAALKKLKPTGHWAEKTKRSIAIVIEELESAWDQTSGEFEELTFEQKDLVWMAAAWRQGESNDRPSEGWEGLAE